MSHRSPSVYPALRYQDGPAAIDWLRKAFGFEPTMVVEADGGAIAHAELTAGDNGMVMLGSAGAGGLDAAGVEVGPASIYVVVDDPDSLHERAVAAGARVVLPLTDEDYGSRGFTCLDPEGNAWSFGTYRPETTEA